MNKRTRNETTTTSEVGSNPPPTEIQQMWSAFFAEQNNTLMEMMRMVREPGVPTRETITLPKYNPDSTDADAGAWCTMVDIVVADRHLEGVALILALSRALTGEASEWLAQTCYPGITWAQFKDLFLQRFGDSETTAAGVMNWLNGRPKNGESISAYGSRMVNSLESKWKNLNAEEIAVSVALAHMARLDTRLQRLVCTTEVRSRGDMRQELKAYSFGADPPRSSVENPTKKLKLSTPIKCHFCGKEGHKIAECRSRRESQNNNRHPTSTNVFSRKEVTCFRCGIAGHIASSCPKRVTTAVHENKRVDTFSIVEPQGTLTHAGESIPFFFDSGAECSLVKESVAKKLSGKRINNIVALRGIGNATVQSTLQILSQVAISSAVIEIVFHVVCDSYLKYDILIGREILSQGFDVLITARHLHISKSKIVNVCSVQNKLIDLNNVVTDLNDLDKTRLISILKTYEEYFIQGVPQRRIKTGQLQIRLVDVNKTVQRRPYRLSEEEREIVREKIQEFKQAGVVRSSCSPFASPVLLVKKKNGTDRLCIDYRELNANTVADKFPLPLISDQIARLRGAKYFSCLDMASGFYQVPVHPESVERTAFVTPDGQFEFTAMPFGLKNAPAVFQRAIMKALGDLVNDYVIVYMDDVMIVSSSMEEGLCRLKVVLDALSDAGFSFNFEKCAFLKTSVEYLGFEVKAGEIRPNPRKIRAISALPPPQTITQLRQFIGLASYFRQFVPKFSEIMKPLYALTSAKTLAWKSEHEKIRLQIISVLTAHPVLIIFDPQYPIELHTDASSEGYGAILMQKIEGKVHVIEYFSKTTSSAESRYHSYELETLAVVNGIKHFRHYLFGRHFVVFTDCNSLKATRTKKELSPRVQRWWAFLQSFDFEIQYREGKRMAHVDCLSRNPLPTTGCLYDKVEQKRVDLAEITSDWFLAEQQRDAEITSMVRKLRENNVKEDVARTYELRSGTLYRKIQRNGKTKCLPVVPRAFRWSIVNNIHESIMHLGWEKTLDKTYEHYWFEKMAKYVRKFVGSCMTCKLSKSASGKVQMELHPIPKVSIPWHTIHVDLTGKLSGKNDTKEYIIVQIDAYTKYVLLHHTLSLDADNCIKAVKSSSALFGLPTRIIADQGRCFAGKKFRDFCHSQNITLHLIATGASRANGQVERVMCTLKNMLTAVETSQRSWQDALGDIQLALNSTAHRITKYSPIELLLGKEAKPFGLMAVSENDYCVDRNEIRALAADNMQKAAGYDKLRVDKNKADVIRFKINDHVLLKNEERHQTKLDPKFRGPFKVIEILEGDRYVLESLNNKRTYKYAHDHLRKLPEGFSPEELDDSENEIGVVNSEGNSQSEMEIDPNAIP